jgi:thiol-disulfide isomerase/thioredoxin
MTPRVTPDPAPPEPAAAPAAGWRARLARLRERRAVRWGLEAAWVLAVVLAIGAWQARGHLGAGERPELTLPALEGPPVSLASLRGKPTLVVLWAPWCGVCKAQSDNVSRVRRLAGERAHVVSIALSYQEVGEVAAYVREQGVEYPVLLGGEDAAGALRTNGYPTAYFLDAEGRVTRSVSGYTTTAGLLLRLLL